MRFQHSGNLLEPHLFATWPTDGWAAQWDEHGAALRSTVGFKHEEAPLANSALAQACPSLETGVPCRNDIISDSIDNCPGRT